MIGTQWHQGFSGDLGVLVGHSDKLFLCPNFQLIEGIPSQDTEAHEIGRIVFIMKFKQFGPDINSQLLGDIFQGIQIS